MSSPARILLGASLRNPGLAWPRVREVPIDSFPYGDLQEIVKAMHRLDDRGEAIEIGAVFIGLPNRLKFAEILGKLIEDADTDRVPEYCTALSKNVKDKVRHDD